MQSLTRIDKIFGAIKSSRHFELSLSDVARRANLSVPTTRRFLEELVNLEYLNYLEQKKKYTLGYKIQHLAEGFNRYKVLGDVSPALREIAKLTRDTVILVIQHGLDALCIERVEGEYPIRNQNTLIGTRWPLGLGAASLSLIAFLDPKIIESIIKKNKERYFKERKKRSDFIMKLVTETQKRKYSVSIGNATENAIGIGLSIFSGKGEVDAAISVSAIEQRMPKDRWKKIAIIMQAELNNIGIITNEF